MKSMVFISYSHINKDIARRLSKRLERIGVDCFLDEKDIGWGSPITQEVSQALADCLALIVIVSASSLKSPWVPFEIGQAISKNKRVLPLLTDPALDLPAYLSSLSYVAGVDAAVKYFKSDSWKQLLSASTASSSPEDDKNEVSRTNYGALLTSLLRLTDAYTHYSSQPPTMSLADYSERENVVKEWLFENRLNCHPEVYQRAEQIVIKMRRFFEVGNQLSMIKGGDGRPDKKMLANQDKELDDDVKLIEQKIRSLR
jgi:hypothetical protein